MAAFTLSSVLRFNFAVTFLLDFFLFNHKEVNVKKNTERFETTQVLKEQPVDGLDTCDGLEALGTFAFLFLNGEEKACHCSTRGNMSGSYVLRMCLGHLRDVTETFSSLFDLFSQHWSRWCRFSIGFSFLRGLEQRSAVGTHHRRVVEHLRQRA